MFTRTVDLQNCFYSKAADISKVLFKLISDFQGNYSSKSEVRSPDWLDFVLRTTDFGLQTPDYRLRTTDFGLQTTDYRLPLRDSTGTEISLGFCEWC